MSEKVQELKVSKKLRISMKTLRKLSDAELGAVGGGNRPMTSGTGYSGCSGTCGCTISECVICNPP